MNRQGDEPKETGGCALVGTFVLRVSGYLSLVFGALLVFVALVEGEPGRGFAPGWGDFEKVLDPALIVVGVLMIVFGLLVVSIAYLATRQ